MLLLAVLSIALNVIGPLVLGAATDLIFAGVIGRQLPPGVSAEEAAAAARAAGNDAIANVIIAQGVLPGPGHRLRRAEHGAAGRDRALRRRVDLRLAAGLPAQRHRPAHRSSGCAATSRRSCNRLPLRYFDGQQRGEVLSRVTNDIDNVAQSLQQTMSQLLTSLLTVVGVLVMMVVVSPLLALVALVSVPLSLWLTKVDHQAVAARSSWRSGATPGS